MFYILISFAFVSTAYSAIYIDAPCPDVKPITNFNLTGTLGTWYEIGRYPNDFEGRGDCASISITPRETGAGFKLVDIANQKQVILEGYVDYAPEAGTSGILNYYSSGFNASEGKNFLQLLLLDVDYDKYCVVFECKYDEAKKSRRDYAWVMARTTKLDSDTQKTVDAFLKLQSFIDTSKMSWEHFDAKACQVKA